MKNNNKNELNNNLPKKYFNIIKKEKCEGFDNNIFFYLNKNNKYSSNSLISNSDKYINNNNNKFVNSIKQYNIIKLNHPIFYN